MAWSKKSRQARGYGRAWELARTQVLRRDAFICQVCLHNKPSRITAAHAVDHIVTKSRGGTDELRNLQAICNACHVAKTLAETGRTLRQRIGADGNPIDE